MKIISLQKDFIEKLRLGDSQAISELYTQTYTYCASFVLKNSGTNDDAKDIFQEVLFAFIKKLRSEDFTIEHDLKAYLFTITKFLWLKRLRDDKKGGLQLVIDDPNQHIEPIAENDLPERKILDTRQQRLYQGLKQLKEDCRQLLNFTFFEKIGDKEIAKQMGYSYAFVPQKRRRCIRKLKTLMV